MDSIRKRSREHLEAVGESYGEHRRFAFAIGWAMVAAGLGCIVHGLAPALFTETASRTIRRLNGMIERREGAAAVEPRHEGLPVLLLLSLSNAVLPWASGAPVWAALPVSLLALAFIPAYFWSEARAEADPVRI